MPEMTPTTPEPEVEIATPRALQAEPEEVILQDPTTRPAAEIEKPIEKPKPKPPDKPKPKPAPPKKTVAKTTEAADKDQAGTESGQTEIEAPSGTAISGMVIGSGDFNYPHWPALAFSKINRFFYFSISIDGKVNCEVRFEVIKSGRIIISSIAASSGIPEFDQACLAAIERSSPLPPLPRDWLDEFIEITITFTNL
jgi:protein TonB